MESFQNEVPLCVSNVVSNKKQGSTSENLLLALNLDYRNVGESGESPVLFSAGGTGLVFIFLFKALFILGDSDDSCDAFKYIYKEKTQVHNCGN